MALTIQQFMAEIEKYPVRMRNAVRSQLFIECESLVSDFRKRSPVDTGYYQSQWMITRNASNKEVNATIRNNTNYGSYLEFGAEIGGEPWGFTPKSFRTGKLYIYQGRVWAGGLDPGKTLSAGGAIGPVLMDKPRRISQITNRLADAAMSGIK